MGSWQIMKVLALKEKKSRIRDNGDNSFKSFASNDDMLCKASYSYYTFVSLNHS